MDAKPKRPNEDPDRVLTRRLQTSRKLLEFAKSGPDKTSATPNPTFTADDARKTMDVEEIPLPVSDSGISDSGISDSGIEVSHNYTRIDNDVFDILPRAIDRAQWRVYLRLYRLSWGFHNNVCRASFGRLEKTVGMSRSAVQAAVSRLCGTGPGYLSIVNTDKRKGNLYRVRLPSECEIYPSATVIETRIGTGADKESSTVSDLGISDLGISDLGIFYIRNNSTKVDNDVLDMLPRILGKAEWYMYMYMYRLSWGYGRNTCRQSLKDLQTVTNISKTVVREALGGLIEKKYISIEEEHNQKGALYRIWLPCEVSHYGSKTMFSRTEKPSIPKSDIPEIGISDFSQSVSETGISDLGTNKEYFNIKQYSKPLLARLVLEFYQSLGQTRISANKQKKGERDCEELFKDGYSEHEIRTAVTWAIKNIPDIHSFGIISSVIGQALAKTERVEAEKREHTDENKNENEKRLKWEKAASEIDEMDHESREHLREEAMELIPQGARSLSKGTLEKMIYAMSVDIIVARKSHQSGVA